jgi:membrane protein
VTRLRQLVALRLVVWSLLRNTVQAWLDDYAPSMGAALAYYTFFSLAPLLFLVIFIAGLVFGAQAAQGQLMLELTQLLGADVAQSVQAVLASVAKPSDSMAGAAISAVVVGIGATSVFAELQNALDRIWRVPANRDIGKTGRDNTCTSGALLSLLRARLLSFGMVLGLAFLLLVSLVLSALIAALSQWWSGLFGTWLLFAQVVNQLVGFALTCTVFAMIYKFLPQVRVAWKDVWIGATVTAAIFSFGHVLIGLYLGRSGIASAYGAAGALVLVLAWVYYSAQVFLLGAEFTWIYARTYGSHSQTGHDIADFRLATS